MKRSYIEIHTSTWEKETHGLFDYEAKYLHKNSFKISNSCTICRNDQECFVQPTGTPDGSTPLLQVEEKDQEFNVRMVPSEPEDRLWLVVKGCKNRTKNGYKLNKGDWIKLGRVQLKVQKISLRSEENLSNSIPNFFEGFERDEIDFVKPESENHEEKTENSPCRICLNDNFTELDPLICPCKCSGSMKFIHLNCLKEWLKSKVSSRVSEKGMSIYLKDLSCEICNSSLPPFIVYQEKQISLMNLNYPTGNYIVLEEYKPDKKQKHGFHIITLDEGTHGMVGRGHDCDLKISDISVSRKHCKIKFHNSEFFIEDTKSKFGTLARICSGFQVKKNTNVMIQIGRTIFQIIYKTPWTIKSLCCCASKNKVSNDSSFFTVADFRQVKEINERVGVGFSVNQDNYDSSLNN